MAKVKLRFLQKPTCTTCRKARSFLLEHGAELDSRDLDKERMSEAELDQLIGLRDYKHFLNPRNELYREEKMGEKPPSRAEAIRYMAETPNLIKRPVVIRGQQIVLGFDEEAYRKLLKGK
jgi:arsenate reductase (glutaredoxin)